MENHGNGVTRPNGYIDIPGDDDSEKNDGHESEETMEVSSNVDESNSKTIDNEAIVSPAKSEDRKSDDVAKKLESWHTVNVFLFFLASFQLINLLTLTYTDSVLNYIAKRFQIPNTMASFIPSGYQVGCMVAIVPISYFGAKWHRPRAICIGVMVMILGLGFCILPHFILPTDDVYQSDGNAWLCKRSRIPLSMVQYYLSELESRNVTFPPINWTKIDAADWRAAQFHADQEEHKKTSWLSTVIQSLASHYHTTDKLISPSLATPQELPCNANATTYNPSVLLILGHVFIGAGSSPLWPLGLSYLDEHLVSRKMPLYLGIFIGTTLTGPVAGFLLGSLSSAIYVTIDSHDLKPTDPAWIGAWWLGYVIAGGLLVILLIPFYFFPSKLKVSEEKMKERELYQVRVATDISANERRIKRTQSDTTGTFSSSETFPLLCQEETNRQRIWKTIIDLLCSIRRLLSMPLVLCCFLAYIILANLLSGVATFGSTFVERQFNIMRITSDMLIGGVCVPLSIAGTFTGGYIMKKLEFTTNQSLLFNVLMACTGTVFLSILFGVGCETPVTAGVTRPYLNERKINATAECNRDCHCPKGEMNLLCSAANVTYLSPCYAGCMKHIPASSDGVTKEAYTGCSCVDEAVQPLYVGPCTATSCTGPLVGAVIAASIGIFILCLCQAPTYTILLRALRVEDKPLAIGLLTFLSRLLGFIPAPIWFALVIDKSCIYWGPKCNGKAVCKLYYNRGLRLNYVGASVACSFAYAAVFAVGAAWLMYSETFREMPFTESSRRDENAGESNRKRLARMRSFTR